MNSVQQSHRRTLVKTLEKEVKSTNEININTRQRIIPAELPTFIYLRHLGRDS